MWKDYAKILTLLKMYTWNVPLGNPIFRFLHTPLPHTGWAKKVSQRNLHIAYQILADFQNSFTVTFSRKFAIKQSLNIPRRYTTLWNIYVIKLACSASCGSLAEKWTLQNPDEWQAAFWALNDMLIVLPSTLTAGMLKIFVIFQFC